MVSKGQNKSRVVSGYEFRGSMREFFCGDGLVVYFYCSDDYYNLYIEETDMEIYIYTHIHKM